MKLKRLLYFSFSLIILVTTSSIKGQTTEAEAGATETPAEGAENTAAPAADAGGTTEAGAAAADAGGSTATPDAAAGGSTAAPDASATPDPAAAGNSSAPAPAPAPPGPAPAAAPTGPPNEDEDNLGPEPEIGHVLMRTEIVNYIESIVSRIVGLAIDRKKRSVVSKLKERYPIVKLLELSKQVMQKTCGAVQPDFFNLAMSAFVNLQLGHYFLIEPYISYSAFIRIESALKRCLSEASPHHFYTGDAVYLNETTDYCENYVTNRATNQTVFQDEIKDVIVPSEASGFITPTAINEPLIETVWKIVVNAHSYCYTRFSDYYNDHHTFTVSMLPLFTNKIQEIWLPKRGYEIKESNMIYGGIIGDPLKTLADINNCVGASREDGSAYPWFIHRPPMDSEYLPKTNKTASNETAPPAPAPDAGGNSTAAPPSGDATTATAAEGGSTVVPAAGGSTAASADGATTAAGGDTAAEVTTAAAADAATTEAAAEEATTAAA